MKRLWMLLLVPALFLAACHLGEPAPIEHQGYQVVFEDNFDTLDRSVWTNMPWFVWEPTAYDISNGVLNIHPPNGRSELVSLGPRADTAPHYPSAKAFKGGYFEARMSFDPASARVTPAFWLWGVDRANQHPDYMCPVLQPEWDQVEIFNKQDPDGTFHAGVHSNTLSPCGVTDVVHEQRTPTGLDLSAWHVYGAKWADGKLSTYLDGNLVTQFDVPSTFTQQMALVLSQSYAPGATTHVDWVKVWQKP